MINLKNPKLNKIVSKLINILHTAEFSVKAVFVRLAAYLNFYLSGSEMKKIHEEKLVVEDPNNIKINLLGAVYPDGNLNDYEQDVKSIKKHFSAVDLSLAAFMENDNSSRLQSMLDEHGIKNVMGGESYMLSSIYRSDAGNVGVIAYRRFGSEAKTRHVKVDIMSRIIGLRKAKADYIIIYVCDHIKNERELGSREKNLFRFFAKLGADYVVGVTPNIRDGGTCYSFNKKISRNVYSVGTFLTSNNNISQKRVSVRIVLRNVHERLCLVHESYYPFYRVAGKGMQSMLYRKQDVHEIEPELLKISSQVQEEMGRIRPADKMLTVGKLMQVIGTELPAHLEYMRDFSVGKLCARTYECIPGDVFFFRQPFDDPNDLVKVSPRSRLKLAKRMSKKALLIVSFMELPVKTPYVVCEDTIEAHISACAYLRSQYNTSYIGITGSVGKTSTKDLLYEVISTKYNTLKSERNSNVQVKIGLDIQKLTDSCQVFIQEIGGGRPGGASRHSRMVLPDVTVVTNIGDAHIGNFGSREKLMENKLGIADGMNENGVMFLNGDDPLLQKAEPGCKAVFYGVNNKNADYYADNIKESHRGVTFDIVHDGKSKQVELNVLGEHNILNAVCCFAIGEHYNIPYENIAAGLARFKTSGIRQNLVNVCGIKLYMDCYNASSVSMSASMEVLSKIPLNNGGKRIAVIGDMTGLGDLAQNVHRDVADKIIKAKPDHIIFFGKNIEETYDIVAAENISCFYTHDRAKLNEHIESVVNPGDVVMVKGSSKALLEYTIDCVFGTRFTDQRLLDEVEFKRVKFSNIQYNLFEHYATALNPVKKNANVRISGSVAGIKVVNIGPHFGYPDLESFVMPDSIRHIANNAFKDCENLEVIKLSPNVKFIGDSAFKNCRSVKSLKLPEKLLHIGEEAFAGCTSLTDVYIPSSVVQIGENAFSNCTELVISCIKNSYADKYLSEKNVEHTRI